MMIHVTITLMGFLFQTRLSIKRHRFLDKIMSLVKIIPIFNFVLECNYNFFLSGHDLS